jgi:hypothetical protein
VTSLTGIWQSGQIVLDGVADWPDGGRGPAIRWPARGALLGIAPTFHAQRAFHDSQAVGSARRRGLSHRSVWRTGGRPARRRLRRRVARPARLTRTPTVVRDQEHGFPAACE